MEIEQSCQFCNDIININELDYHNKICIYYIYNMTYNKFIPKSDIEHICYIANLFNLYKFSTNTNFNIHSIIKTLIIKQYINSNPIIEYLINYLNNMNIIEITYNDILIIIESLTHYSQYDILNIINSYRICYKNLD
jgi:hypothetical protein